MSRHLETPGLILKRYPVGESHLGVVLFTRERGLLHALAHGAFKTKGKLRLLSQGFCEIKGELYHDPVADSWKITGAETLYFPDSFSSSLEKYYLFSFWAEMILKTYGSGGESQDLYDLVARGLRLLDRGTESRLESLKFQILWRYFIGLGWGPDFSHCVHCGTSLEGREAFFSFEDHGLACPRDRRSGDPPLLPGITAYLRGTLGMDLEDSLRISLAPEAGEDLSRLGESYLQRLTGQGLKTLRTARGII